MRRFLPSLSALQAFEAAARYMSFTKAADELAVTQSGISRHINNLEQYLGVRLFERSGSRLVLTDAGGNYFREVAQIIDKLEEVSIDAVRGRKADASLMIGANPSLATRWLAPRLSGFVDKNREMPIEIAPVGSELDFDQSRIDVAILRGVGSWPNARASLLFPERLAVVASPKLIPATAKLNRLNFSETPTLQNASRPSLWLSWLRTTKLSHSGVIQGIRFANSDMLISAALSGLGLAVVPSHYVEQELARGELHLPFGKPVESSEGYWVVYSERKAQKQSVALFRDWLLSETRKHRSEVQA
ncbi:LysR substrate-binding domain-containing protein [Microvirga guangxiensis]|uniref:DNA-binding transcriptional regulator, LysR family n=1 Tax=Microvirga guangxiensis TaxID=549386 RepID=A0A1G5KZH9_9HYPH|nr:LysR substrate-binding domain-containing protein [Microvirga guangxiensis]SCZ05744.1 DNA-binding transcriptional regulator, LysR family [Microvirga guangxiensis]